MSSTKRWRITSEKFLNLEQIERLKAQLLDRRDLAIARENDEQAIRDHYCTRALLETGLRVFEFCALLNGDVRGTRLSVRCGKGDKPRTVLLTRGTSAMFKEWIDLKKRLGHDFSAGFASFPEPIRARLHHPWRTKAH